MAVTAAGRRLTSDFRRGQLAIRSRLLRRVLDLWPQLDVRRLDATAPEWQRAMVAAVMASRMESARAAATYYEQLRAVELPDAAPLRSRWLDENTASITAKLTPIVETSLAVTGPVNLKRRTKRFVDETTSTTIASATSTATLERAIDKASSQALVDVSGAAARHALDGGRQLLREEGAQDELAVAFARVSDGDPCYFCALMISRGFVYRSRASAGRSANSRFTGPGLYKFHDHDACTVEPVFHRDAPLDDAAERYDRIYRDASAEAAQTGKPVLAVFRQRYENRT